MTGMRKSAANWLSSIEEIECCDVEGAPKVIASYPCAGCTVPYSASSPGYVGHIAEGSEMVFTTNTAAHAGGGFRICV